MDCMFTELLLRLSILMNSESLPHDNFSGTPLQKTFASSVIHISIVHCWSPPTEDTFILYGSNVTTVCCWSPPTNAQKNSCEVSTNECLLELMMKYWDI